MKVRPLLSWKPKIRGTAGLGQKQIISSVSQPVMRKPIKWVISLKSERAFMFQTAISLHCIWLGVWSVLCSLNATRAYEAMAKPFSSFAPYR
jgi:hypothetical protein